MKYPKAVAAFAVAVALSVAGCGGGSNDPSPIKSESTPEKSESSSPSPTPTEAAQEQAAIDAIKTWVETSNKVSRTLDPTAAKELKALSVQKCRTCKLRVDQARELANVGGSYQGDFEEKVRNFRVTGDSGSADQLQILADVRTGDWQMIGKGGTIKFNDSASEDETLFVMKREADQWLVREVIVKEEG